MSRRKSRRSLRPAQPSLAPFDSSRLGDPEYSNLFSRVYLKSTQQQPQAGIWVVHADAVVAMFGSREVDPSNILGIEQKTRQQLNLETVLLNRESTMTQRLDALRSLMQLVKEGSIARTEPIPESNNHIHTWASFSPYSPAAAVWASYLAGLEVTGIIDHDTVAGNYEFLEAARICEMKATNGLEFRTNASDDSVLSKLVWNNPGIPNSIYFLAHGVPEKNLKRFQREMANPILQAKDKRNRAMIEDVNRLLSDTQANFTLNYDEDILPLTFREGDSREYTGNATDRHLMLALAKKINDNVDEDDKQAFVEKLIGRKLIAKESRKLSNEEDFKDVLRSGLLKPPSDKAPKSVLTLPDERENPNIKVISKKIKELGGIPVYAYLGDPSTDEDNNLEEIVRYLKESGVEGIAIMPHRNTPEQIKRITHLVKKYDMIIISGVDINRKDMPLIHPRATSAEYPEFRTAANLLVGHERISVFGDIGYSSRALEDEFTSNQQRLEFLADIGRFKGMTEKTIGELARKLPAQAIRLIQKAIEEHKRKGRLEGQMLDINLGIVA